MSQQHRTDWWKIFEDFEALRYTLDELGERTRLPLDVLRRASVGVVQARVVGDAIIAAWCHLTMKSVEFIPLLPEVAQHKRAPAAAAAPALGHDVSAPTSQLETLTRAWRGLHRD